MIEIHNEIELLSCLSCKRKRASLYQESYTSPFFLVKCRYCGAQTAKERTKREAINKWNARGGEFEQD